MLNQEFFTGLTKGLGVAEGLSRVRTTLVEGIKAGTLSAFDVPSFGNLGVALGVLQSRDDESGWRRALHDVGHMNTEGWTHEEVMGRIFNESNGNVRSGAFVTIMGELISSEFIKSYEATPSVADQLIRTLPNQRVQNQKIVGLSHMGGFFDTVAEGHPHPETDMSEKYVTTYESKVAGGLSITEETLLFDRTGLVYAQAQKMGQELRNQLERTKMRGIQDLLGTGNNYVYRPSGTGEALYNVDGSNLNYIGASNTTSTAFNAAVPLVDWTDLDTVLQYRALEVKDDRIDGTARPIGGINSNLTLLVPMSKYATARNVVYGDQVRTGDGASSTPSYGYSNPNQGFITQVLTSVYLDENSTADYYVGNFKDQFLWTEIYPVQTFMQGAGSESSFNNDVVLRMKARYYGGLSALESRYVTKVDGV